MREKKTIKNKRFRYFVNVACPIFKVPSVIVFKDGMILHNGKKQII